MSKYYNIYRINKETGDLDNMYGGENRQDVANYLQIRIDNFSKYVAKNMEQLPQKTKVINNEHYIIIIDND